MTIALQAARKRLTEQHKRITEELDGEKELQRELGEMAGEECLAHPGDGGSETFEQEMNLAVQENLFAILKEVEHALHKLDTGSYGVCDECGQPIPEERLRIRPQAALCVACKSKQERHQHMPARTHGILM